MIRSAQRLCNGLVVLGILISAASASAQVVGEAILPLDIRSLGTEVYVGFDSDYDHFIRAEALGGVTLFAALTPGGPLVARMAFPPPFSITLEGVPGLVVPHVPPGTYYITAVFGIVTTPTVPPSHWSRVGVATSPPCATAPGPALLTYENRVQGSTRVALFMNSVARCATSFLVDAGSAPGLADLAQFERASQVFLSSTVPAGSYYVRIRGRNALGIGPYSEVVPVSVPDCIAQAPAVPTNLTAQVTGGSATLSWSVATPPTFPPTFTEVFLYHVPQSPPPSVLIPSGATSITAAVAPGDYRVGIAVGNACGKSYSNVISFTVP